MEIISFDVCGKLAHFRKYYANNTAFTYSMPPRTTVMGVLAGMAGYERDTYYERLASEHLRIGIRILSPIKKAFHRLNFLSIKSRGDALEGTGDFTGAGGRIQTPFEVVSGQHLGKDWVHYRIFLAPGINDNGEFDRMKAVLGLSNERGHQGSVRFNITLGIASFSAWIENARSYGDVVSQTSGDILQVHSAIPSDNIKRLQFQKDDPDDGFNFLEEELMPADFVANHNRELSKLLRVLFSTQGKPFSAEAPTPFFSVPDETGSLQNIFFLE